jgi:hypothetical protein
MIVTLPKTRLQYVHSPESMDSALTATDPIECHGEERLVHTEKSRKREKLVQFFPIVEMHETLHVNDYTDEEVAVVWYSERDFAYMGADPRLVLELFECGVYPGDDDDQQLCLRGLEGRTKQGARERRYNKGLGRTAVLREQSLQECDSRHDPEAIAREYALATKHCSAAALEVGRMDEWHASGRVPSFQPSKRVSTSQKRRVGPLSSLLFRLRNMQ